jgi:hypothetical protein
MNIDIKKKQTTHGWVVHMDALEVSFNTQEEANAFVGQLQARIDAPHRWPNSSDLMVFPAPALGCCSAPVNETTVRADLVTPPSGEGIRETVPH